MLLLPLLFLLPFLVAASGDPLLDVLSAVMDGNGRVIAAAVLSLVMLVVAGMRERVSWLRGDRGGTLLLLFLSFTGAVMVSLREGTAIAPRLFLTALEVALIAIGGYTGVKRLIWPKDAPATVPATETPPVEPPPTDLPGEPR